MLLTGLRPGEVLSLDKDKDLNFNFKRITVRRTITKDINERACLGSDTKTENGVRSIAMSDSCKNLLNEIIKKWAPNPFNLLFYDYENNHLISPNQLNSAFKHIVLKYKIINYNKVFAPLSEKKNPVRFKKYTFYKKENDSYKSMKTEPADWWTNQKQYFLSRKFLKSLLTHICCVIPLLQGVSKAECL